MKRNKTTAALFSMAILVSASGLIGCTSMPGGETTSYGMPRVEDSALAFNVLNAVRQSMDQEAKDIEVTAESGVVTLSGWARQPLQESRARQLATKVPGVTKVYSHIRLWSTSDHD